MLHIHHTKKDIKSWIKESAKKSRDAKNSLSHTIQFTIKWSELSKTEENKKTFNKHEYDFLSMLKECIRHAQEYGVIENTPVKAILKIPLYKLYSRPKDWDFEDEKFEVEVGFKGLDEYKDSKLFQKQRRNTHINLLRHLQNLILHIIDVEQQRLVNENAHIS